MTGTSRSFVGFVLYKSGTELQLDMQLNTRCFCKCDINYPLGLVQDFKLTEMFARQQPLLSSPESSSPPDSYNPRFTTFSRQ